jgi:hypothetical protein
MAAELHTHLEPLKTRLRLGGVPLIVVGSGLSAGVGAPTMNLIHRYFEREIDPRTSQTARTIHALVEILIAEPEYPRSVSVRLYHLLQTSLEETIRREWQAFGVNLLAGRLAGSSMKPLWELEPSAGHYWVARLATSARAIVLSLNYDGLTHRAVDAVATAGQARVLSTAEEIRQFFTGVPPPSSTSPIPIIKIRGDVFHAECENGRCPDLGKSVPIYQLWQHRRAGASPEKARDPEERAREYLKCPICHEPRGLQISFPGVLGKEEAIDETLMALHQIHGSRIACVIFLGFSGQWDEALVRYLAGRAADLGAPLISFSLEPTPAIARVAEEARAEYFFRNYESKLASFDKRVSVFTSMGPPFFTSNPPPHLTRAIVRVSVFLALLPFFLF